MHSILLRCCVILALIRCLDSEARLFIVLAIIPRFALALALLLAMIRIRTDIYDDANLFLADVSPEFLHQILPFLL